MALQPPPGHIAIIGGGFNGVMTAVNLARLSGQALQIGRRLPSVAIEIWLGYVLER